MSGFLAFYLWISVVIHFLSYIHNWKLEELTTVTVVLALLSECLLTLAGLYVWFGP